MKMFEFNRNEKNKTKNQIKKKKKVQQKWLVEKGNNTLI